jgi:hypothetical protein
MTNNRFSFTYRTIRVGVVALLLFLSHNLHAQVDTLALADSIVITTDEESYPAVVDSIEAEMSEDEENIVEFLKKGTTGSGIDSPRFRQINDSVVRSLQKDEDFWYANMVFPKGKAIADDDDDDERTGIFDSNAFQLLLWIVIVVSFIAFLVIYLSNSNVRLFRKNVAIADSEEDIEISDDIFSISYQKEIDKAIATGNYRLAVRLLFLQLLRRLSDKELIQYKQDRTNFDYLLQVSKANWYPQFFRLTRHYEYVWYGKFDINSQQFDTIRKDFGTLDKQLSQT